MDIYEDDEDATTDPFEITDEDRFEARSLVAAAMVSAMSGTEPRRRNAGTAEPRKRNAATAEPRKRNDAKITARLVLKLIQVNAAVEFVDSNPKRPGTKSHDLFNKYRQASTVNEILQHGGRKADVSFDLARGYFKLTDPTLRTEVENELSRIV